MRTTPSEAAPGRVRAASRLRGSSLGWAPVARTDGRSDDELRPIEIRRGFQQHPAGSVLVSFGGTRVLCAASVTEGVPRWRRDSGLGWLTAEYAMLPSATHTRSDRESVKGRVGGRTHEISRLVGRSLRAAIDLKALGENTIQLDCDVLQADGGTRTAAITGAYVALADAVTWLKAHKRLADPQPLSCSIAAVSVGVVDGRVRLDLPYEEDSRAEVDMNVVATDAGTLVEVQGTGEGATYTRATLDAMLDSALAGIARLTEIQAAALAEPYPGELP
jgi:ribonuclease PH